MIPFHCMSCGHDSMSRVVEEKKPCISQWKGERIHGYGCKKYVECCRCGFTALINPFGTKPDAIKITGKAHDAVITSATGM